MRARIIWTRTPQSKALTFPILIFVCGALRSALAHNFKYERDFVGQTIDIFDFHQGVQKNPLKSQSHP